MFKILLIVVLYKNRLFDSNCYKTLLKANEKRSDFDCRFFVYDNSPIPMHSEEDMTDKNIIYISDINNSGISKAYNTGAQFAFENDYHWMLFLDQDTIFPNGYLDDLVKNIINHPCINLFVPKIITLANKYMSPSGFFMQYNYTKSFLEGVNSVCYTTFINSGLTISLSSFIECGKYNENIYLDFSDVEFVERWKERNGFFYLTNSTVIQDFSNEEKNVSKLLSRFAIFCKCAKAYRTELSLIDGLCLDFIVLKACFSRMFRTLNVRFFIILSSRYIFK